MISTALSIQSGMNAYIVFTVFTSIHNNAQLFNVILITFLSGLIFGTLFVISLNCILSKVDKLNFYLNVTLVIALLSFTMFGFTIPELNAIATNSNISDGLSTTMLYCYLVFGVIISICANPVFFIEGLLLRDLIMFDTLTTGLNRENMYQVAIGIPATLISTVLSSIPIIILFTTGFGINKTQQDDYRKEYYWNNSSIEEIAVFTTLVTGIIAIISYYNLRTYPFSTRIAEQINKVVKARELKKAQKENEADADGGGNGTEGTSTSLSGSHARLAAVGDGIDDIVNGKGSIVNNKEEMIMLHFSQLEVRALAKSHITANGENERFNEISRQNMIGLFFFGPATMASCFSGLIVQMIKNETRFATLLLVVVLIASMYCFYEVMRFGIIRECRKVSGEELKTMAVEGAKRNATHHESLADLFARNGITENDNAIIGGVVGRDTIPNAQIDNPYRESIVAPFEVEEDSNLPGYKRIYFTFSGLIIFGILAATIL